MFICFEESSQPFKDWVGHLLTLCQQYMNKEEGKYCEEKTDSILPLLTSLQKELRIWEEDCCLTTATEVLSDSN